MEEPKLDELAAPDAFGNTSASLQEAAAEAARVVRENTIGSPRLELLPEAFAADHHQVEERWRRARIETGLRLAKELKSRAEQAMEWLNKGADNPAGQDNAVDGVARALSALLAPRPGNLSDPAIWVETCIRSAADQVQRLREFQARSGERFPPNLEEHEHRHARSALNNIALVLPEEAAALPVETVLAAMRALGNKRGRGNKAPLRWDDALGAVLSALRIARGASGQKRARARRGKR